jgi:putative intracellular protease/amidase
MKKRKILMVVTSHGRIDDSHESGLWFEEFFAPYKEFEAAGYEITIASPEGGVTPLDKKSLQTGSQMPKEADLLQNTIQLSDINAAEYDAIFLTGGHGTMFDYPSSADLKIAVKTLARQNKPVASVCHGVAGLVGIQMDDGKPFVAEKHLTSFTNEEERMVKLENLVPFMLETRLKELGAIHKAGPSFTEHVIVDGNLITGQNPMSGKKTAQALIELLS